MSLPINLPTETPPAEYVEQAAALLGFTLAAEHRPGVVAQMAVLTRIAGPLLEFALAPDIEPAPVYEP